MGLRILWVEGFRVLGLRVHGCTVDTRRICYGSRD